MTPELETALRDLEGLAARRGRPTRHDARPLLLSLGGALEEGLRADAEAARIRIQSLPAEFLERWAGAVQDELSMAATEHVRSVDPRYLEDAAYDFEYTIQARRGLGARLTAAEFLGLPADEALLSGIGRADSILERYSSSRGKRPGF